MLKCDSGKGGIVMNAVVTVKSREKLLKARAGAILLPKIVGFAFGNGGADVDGNVISPDEKQVELNSELLRKNIDNYTITSDTTCRYECTLAENELVGEKISEIALYDAEGDLVAIKTFSPKEKDGDFQMTFQVDDVF